MDDVKVNVFNALHGNRLSSLTDQLPDEFDYFYVGLYGSQNYDLDNENSDVDAKAIVVPSFDELIEFKGKSKSFSFEDGILDVKDVRLMFEQFLKMNINFLEILFTDDFVYNTFYEGEVLELRDMAEDIAASNKVRLLRSNLGMMRSKFNSVFMISSSNADEVVLYGYSPKDAASVLRVGEFLFSYLDRGLSFKEALSIKSSEKESLIRKVREGSVDRNFVFQVYEEEMAKVNKFASIFTSSYEEKQNYEVASHLKDLERRIIEKALRRDILS